MHARLYPSSLHFSLLKYLRHAAPRSARPLITEPYPYPTLCYLNLRRVARPAVGAAACSTGAVSQCSS